MITQIHKGRREVCAGVRIINGRPHGVDWRGEWGVEIWFDSEDERDLFMAQISEYRHDNQDDGGTVL